jgi:aspartate/methionine/tyrosine aminotransferase
MTGTSELLGRITPSATLAISTKARTMRADGIDVVSYSAGEPDFPTPDHIVEAAAAACRVPAFHKYSAAAGLPELREAIADAARRHAGIDVAANQVLVTNGGKHAVYTAFMTLLDPGDEVLLPAPYWVTYPEAIALAGGTTVRIPTDETTGYRATIDQLDAAVTDRTKALVFVSPSNPTGSVYPPDEVAAIGRWAASRGIWVISDDIYEHLVYGDNRFTSMPAAVPELAERTLIVNGVAKAYSMTGWRVGWMIGPADAVSAAAGFQSHVTSNVSNVAQAAALAALTGPFDSVLSMREAFDRRRQTMHRLLAALPGVETVESQGAFYEFPSFKGVLGAEVGGRIPTSTLELAEILLEQAHAAIVPGEAFGAPGYMRFSYALGDDDLERGLGRIADLLGAG